MANTTLRYQEVGAQGLRPFRSMGTGKRGEVLDDFTFLHIPLIFSVNLVIGTVSY